jgi:hypothetical protein
MKHYFVIQGAVAMLDDLTSGTSLSRRASTKQAGPPVAIQLN